LILTKRWIFETQTNGKEYSFVCKTIKDLGCINIYGRDNRTEKSLELNRLSLVASTNAVILQHLMGTINWANEGL
jgi:hypothetical protein